MDKRLEKYQGTPFKVYKRTTEFSIVFKNGETVSGVISGDDTVYDYRNSIEFGKGEIFYYTSKTINYFQSNVYSDNVFIKFSDNKGNVQAYRIEDISSYKVEQKNSVIDIITPEYYREKK